MVIRRLQAPMKRAVHCKHDTRRNTGSMNAWRPQAADSLAHASGRTHRRSCRCSHFGTSLGPSALLERRTHGKRVKEELLPANRFRALM